MQNYISTKMISHPTTTTQERHNNKNNNTNNNNDNGKHKQGDFWDNTDYNACYINYDNLINCISKQEPSVNVIYVKGIKRQYVVAA